MLIVLLVVSFVKYIKNILDMSTQLINLTVENCRDSAVLFASEYFSYQCYLLKPIKHTRNFSYTGLDNFSDRFSKPEFFLPLGIFETNTFSPRRYLAHLNYYRESRNSPRIQTLQP